MWHRIWKIYWPRGKHDEFIWCDFSEEESGGPSFQACLRTPEFRHLWACPVRSWWPGGGSEPQCPVGTQPQLCSLFSGTCISPALLEKAVGSLFPQRPPATGSHPPLLWHSQTPSTDCAVGSGVILFLLPVAFLRHTEISRAMAGAPPVASS